MFIAKRLRGATSFLVLASAAVVPAQVQGEVAMAQIAPKAAVVRDGEMKAIPQVKVAVNDLATIAKDAPLVKVEPAADAAEDEGKHLGDGVASFYGNELAGNRTASGERFNPKQLTAAHRTLPIGSKIRVTNKANGKSVVVRINDRGPFAKSRIIDLSHAAAQQISMVRSGTARVKLELI
jgi:rare lipoprotein A